MTDRIREYDVTWTTPSADASGSMPLGNGDLALNAWVEPGGDLLLLLAKSDAWDENSINLKLGRVRVTFTPPLLSPGVDFRQTLRLLSGDIEITAGPICLRLWVDANRPVIRLEADGDAPFEMRAVVEMWRTEPRQIKTQTSDMFKNLAGKNADPHPTIVSPDRVITDKSARVVWCHHNEPRDPDAYEVNMRLQGLGGFIEKMPHPLAGRTFGAAMEGQEFVRDSDLALRTAGPGTRRRLYIFALTMHPATVEEWSAELYRTINTIRPIDPKIARAEHEQWWRDFWDRSYIYIDATESNDDGPFLVTRAYALCRFMNAAAGRGREPIKHNGSLFTVGRPDDPDYRRWGGPGFWFQNQRLIYWPMLAAGDFDLMRPFFQLYRDALELQRHRTRTYFDHGGAHYPETITFWGAEVSSHYEWTPFEQRQSPEAGSPYLKYYWTGGVELTLMMVEFYDYTFDHAFARDTLLPVADAISEFFDLHYPRDASGKIRFSPAQSLETWHTAVNPTPEIAGLRYTLGRLLALPEDVSSPALRVRWTRMLSELPDLPVGEKEGKPVILPAETFDLKKNTENPELYCVFPYRLFGVGKPGLELARNTFDVRLHSYAECWSQDDVQLALLGRAEQARDWLVRRSSPAMHSDSRFPAFWNPFHDWVPDVDHGGVLQLALQLMLLQTDGRSSQPRLLPAWPREWNATFKLHAPGNVVLSGTVVDGEVVGIETRRA